MARIARVEAINYPHHVIQRGNRRQRVFIKPDDKGKYLNILELQSRLFGLEIWAYCLMDNHVHLVVVPKQEGSLRQAISETHRLYTRMINFREGWRGYLWEGRFKSTPLDEGYLYAAVRYVERNPVRAKIVEKAEDYQWSSALAHIKGERNGLLTKFYLEEGIKDWNQYLKKQEDENKLKCLRRHTATGRPLGEERFMEKLENDFGRVLKKLKPGPKKN
ncbi:MAG: transposase [Candidatus Omnitrophica bacterium]|nr:transposase [Candidatus Omnitrophota bacterium]